MFRKMNSLLFRAREEGRNEFGASDLVTAVLMIPLAVYLIFSLINVTFYMQARSSVQQVVRDGVRQVALYGGQQSNLPLNTSGKTVSSLVKSALYKNGDCTKSFCYKPPVVSCSPGKASKVGQQVSCKVTYTYKPLVNDIFGFAAMTAKPFTISETSLSETGYR